MVSLITNTAAKSALATLRTIDSGLSQSQDQVATGLRVGKASDNAAYWSIGTTMRSENKSLSAVSDSIGLARAIVDTAYQGMDKVLQGMTSIRSLIVTASALQAPQLTSSTNADDPSYWGTEVGKVDRAIMQEIQGIRSVVASSSFAGVNLLRNEQGQPDLTSSSSVNFVVGVTGGKVQTAGLKLENTVIFNYARTTDPTMLIGPAYDSNPPLGHLDSPEIFGTWTWNFTVAGGTGAKDVQNTYFLRNGEFAIPGGGMTREQSYEQLIQQVDAKIRSLTDGMAGVGAFSKTLEGMEKVNDGRIDTVTKGIGLLVDADMNEASTRMKALQTQQQLGVQALSIANTTPQSILQLFR